MNGWRLDTEGEGFVSLGKGMYVDELSKRAGGEEM